MRTTKIAAAMALLAGLVAGPAHAQEKTFRIQDYPGIGNMLARVAASKGFCAQHGIKCQMQTIPSGPLGVQALLAGSIDVAFPPPEVAINAALRGAKLKIISSGARNAVFELVGRNGLTVPDGDKDYKAMMVALKGKKIGVPARGSGAEMEFALLAEKAGISPRDYTYVAVGGPNTSFGALKSKQVDASMTFEPSASICNVLKACKTLYRASRAPEPQEIAKTNGASAVLVVTQGTIDKSPKAVQALIAALGEAQAFIQNPANFAETLKIAQSYFRFKMPKGDAVMEASLKYSIPSFKTGVSRDALKQIAANMLETKQIHAPFDTATIVYAKAP